jgi:hypothetical protein
MNNSLIIQMHSSGHMDTLVNPNKNLKHWEGLKSLRGKLGLMNENDN